MTGRLRLGVNIDHVATVRNARGGDAPDLLRAAAVALEAGADGITAHLREDRRHIRDADLEGLVRLTAGAGRPLNLEMAATEEMIGIACSHRPAAVCLVPERREERTTEGGLDVVAGGAGLASAVRRLRDEAGARVSLFIAPDPRQIDAAAAAGAAVVELHTGAFCDALRTAPAGAEALLGALQAAALRASRLGLEVHAGHGIDYGSAGPVAGIAEVVELNIGHFLIGEAIFAGLGPAIARMREVMDAARGAAGRPGGPGA